MHILPTPVSVVLVSVVVPPKLAAFVPVDPQLGTLHCQDVVTLQQRASRLEEKGIRLIAVRHGESEANANGGGAILSGRGDSPLSENGRIQANQAARQLYEQLGGASWLATAACLPVLIASPLSRAFDTGEALLHLLQSEASQLGMSGERLAAVQNLTVRKDADLQEIDFGSCEGRDAREIAKTYPNFGKGLDFTHRFPDGESGIDVMTRVDRVLNRVEEECAGKTVIFFAHTMTVGLSGVLLGQVSHNADGCLFVDRSKIPNAAPIQLTP